VDAAKATIAHAHDLVTGAGNPRNGADQFIQLVAHQRLVTHRRQGGCGIPAQAGAVTERQVRTLQAPGQQRLHGAEFHGVGARLEHRQDAFARLQGAAQAVQRGADGGGVVRKIVIHGDLALAHSDCAAHFHAAFDIFKAAQCCSRGVRWHAQMVCRCNRRQRVELVVHAGQTPADMANDPAVLQYIKVVRRTCGGEVADRCAKAADLAPAALVQHPCQAFLQPIDHHAATAMWAISWNGADQVVKLALDSGQVVKDVGVVEFEVVEHRSARAVVHKLAAFVKKCRVVFVRFDHKGFALAKSSRDAEVQRHAAHQKAGLQARLLQNPGGHGGGGGFAVGACYGHHMAALQEMFAEPLRAAGVGQACVQNRFHQRKFGTAIGQPGAADHIAHHKQVWFQGQLFGAETFDEFDPQRAQLIARQRGQAAHKSAANTQDMNVHRWILKTAGAVPTEPMPGRKANQGRIHPSMNNVQTEIAAQAARWVVEEGLEYGPAKRRAVKAMGLNARVALPSNELVEDAVRDYIAVFCSDTQPQELLALRRLAQVWMERLQEFRPHLGGAVWHGTATRLSDIYLQLFCDDCKSAEIALIDKKVNYVPRSVTGFHGDTVEALSVHAYCADLKEEVGVHLMIYDRDDVRGALLPDAKGRAPRGDLQALRRLLAQVGS